jgi:putative transposase
LPVKPQGKHSRARWVAAGMSEARKQFRRINGHLHLPTLRAALDATITTVTPSKEDAA